jgi:hypothetical protein
MQIVREYINEKFTEDSDPIHDLGIGLNHMRNFKTEDEIANFLINIMSGILHTSEIPKDIIKDKTHLFNIEYIPIIDDYIMKYIKLDNKKYDNRSSTYDIFDKMMNKLKKLGYKTRRCINESFTDESDPIHDLGIGINHVRNFKNTEEIEKFLIKFMPFILHTDKIPEDIAKDQMYVLNIQYIPILNDYLGKYLRLNNNNITTHDRWSIYHHLQQYFVEKGYVHHF